MPVQEVVGRLLICMAATPEVDRLLRHLAVRRGLLPRADDVARGLGLGSRHQLHQLLKRNHLPSLTRCAAWARVLTLAVEMCRGEVAFENLAWRDGVHPEVDHRRVRRILRTSLRAALREGLDGVLWRIWRDWAEHLDRDGDWNRLRADLAPIVRDAVAAGE